MIQGDSAVPIELARGLRGRTRISSYVEPDGEVNPPGTLDPNTAHRS